MKYLESKILYILLVFGCIRSCFETSFQQALVFLTVCALLIVNNYAKIKESKETDTLKIQLDEIQREVNALTLSKGFR